MMNREAPRVWRGARESDDAEIVRLCLALNAEDPGPHPVPESHMRRTLQHLRRTPEHGRAAVLEINGKICGYALLISFWSNEAGGEACLLDEIYVVPEQRGRGQGSRLIEDIATGSPLVPPDLVALVLEVTSRNDRARRLYERLGFQAGNTLMRRRVRPLSGS